MAKVNQLGNVTDATGLTAPTHQRDDEELEPKVEEQAPTKVERPATRRK